MMTRCDIDPPKARAIEIGRLTPEPPPKPGSLPAIKLSTSANTQVPTAR